MKDLKTMLKKLNMEILSTGVDEETGENVFMLAYGPFENEDVKIYRYTDIVDEYNKKIKEEFDF